MTNEQIDFILQVEETFDHIHRFDPLEPLPGGGWRIPVNRVFGELFKAIARNDDIEVARITAMMLLEIYLQGNAIQFSAWKWCELFGPLFAAA